MDRITQDAYQRQRILRYTKERGVTAAATQYETSRKTVHKWRKRYDGTLESLKDQPRHPHKSPRRSRRVEVGEKVRQEVPGRPAARVRDGAEIWLHAQLWLATSARRSSFEETPLSPERRARTSRISEPSTPVKSSRWA